MTAADPETKADGARSPREPVAAPAGVRRTGSSAEPAAADYDGSAKAPTKPGAKPKADPRAERLAAALRANLGRRKAARRAGLDDFEPPEDGGKDA